MRTLRIVIGGAGLALAFVAPAAAQEGSPARHPWAAFFGCWAPVDGARSLSVTCVLPAADSPQAAEQLSVVAGNILRSVTLEADGQRREIDAEGCVGWESAAFAVDAARVYTRGSATCAAGAEQLTSGVLSITADGHFLQVVAVRVGEQSTLSTQRLEHLSWVDIPASIQPRLAPLATLAAGARTLAARPLDFAAVEDALQFADAAVVEAWMAETGTGGLDFKVTRRELQRLVDLDAPTRIIDMSVALANPAQFEPRVERSDISWRTTQQRSWLGSDMRMDAFCGQFQVGMSNWRDSFSHLSLYPGLGLSYYSWFPECAGRGFYSRWAFSPYGYGNNWYSGPYVGVPSTVTVTPRRTPGTVSKGNGYRRGAESTASGGSGQPRAPGTVRAEGSTASSSAGSSNGSSSGGTRSAGSNGSGRTAQPRNPD